MRHNFLSADFEGEKIVFDGIFPNDPLVIASGKNRIGYHESCGGNIFASLNGNKIIISCDKFTICRWEELPVPLSVDTSPKLKLYLDNISNFPRSMGER